MRQDPLLDLSERKVLVTGAGGGIGGATARALSERGADLVLVDRLAPDEVRKRIGGLPGKAEVLQLDTSVRVIVERAVEETGPFTDLVDTAAIYGGGDWTDPGWDDVLDGVLACNIKGPVNLARAVLPGMQTAGGGRIVLVGSVAGHMGGIRSGPDYAFTKGGLHAFAKWLARRYLPDGVLVNVVAPGPVETGMTDGKGYDVSALPLGRMAHPDEIAAMILCLLGPGLSYATGAIFDVNGGTYYR